jgi:putative transposase
MAERKNGKGSRRSRQEWQSLLAKLDDSGLGIDAFCRREAISAASLYRWRRLLGDVGDRDRAEVTHTTPAFVDLGTLNSVTPSRPQLDLKLELGDGLVLHLVRH